MAPKKNARKTIGKKDMKKTKGGLLPAVNQLNFNTGIKIDSALKINDSSLNFHK